MSDLEFSDRYERRDAEDKAVRNYFLGKSIGSLSGQILIEFCSSFWTLPVTISSMVVGHIGRNMTNDDGSNLFFMTGYEFTDAMDNKSEIIERLPQNKKMETKAFDSGLLWGFNRALAPIFHFAVIPLAVTFDSIGYGLKGISAASFAVEFWDKDNMNNARDAFESEFTMQFFHTARDWGHKVGALTPTQTQIKNSEKNSLGWRNRVLNQRDQKAL